MLTVGDTVVTMSYPGVFVIIAIDGEHVTIRNDAGELKVVGEANLRRLRGPEPAISS